LENPSINTESNEDIDDVLPVVEIKSVLLTDVRSMREEKKSRGAGSFEEQISELNTRKIALEEQLSVDVNQHTSRGYDDGFEDGLRQGIEAGERKAMDINQETVNKLHGLIEKLEIELSETVKEIQTVVAESIGVALKNSYFGSVALNKDMIANVVEKCLSSVPIYAKTVVVSCSKEDYSLINEYDSKLKTIVDDKLVSGEISINTDVNFVKVTGEQMAQSTLKNILAGEQ